MNIAICDDDEIFSEKLKKLIVEMHGFDPLQIECYDCGKKLLKVIEKRIKEFDLIFLDIKMEKISGIETAERIRKSDKKVFLVFVTNFPSYWSFGYDLKALNYLVKPVEPEQIKKIVNEVEALLPDQQEGSLFINNKDIQVSVPLADIKYFEVLQRKVYVFTIKETFSFYGNLKRMDQELSSKGFFRIHSSFLLNLSFFYKRSGEEVFLLDGSKLPIARNRIKHFKQTLIQHNFKGEMIL